jgi:small subunit ribosomal protein S9
MSATSFSWGLGRRKTSVARVRLTPGTGQITINRKSLEAYVTVERLRKYVTTPLEVTQLQGKFDIHVNVDGGGVTGQAGACVLGISRALIKADPTSEVALRRHGLLTRDSRMVERKKYGLHKARRGCQFSKR